MYDELQNYPPSFYLGGVTVVFSGLLIIIPLCFRKDETPTLEEEYSKAFLDGHITVDDSKIE